MAIDSATLVKMGFDRYGETRSLGVSEITFKVAGQGEDMEAFFREVTKASSMPKPDPELWRAHGMELLGPPLSFPLKVIL